MVKTITIIDICSLSYFSFYYYVYPFITARENIWQPTYLLLSDMSICIVVNSANTLRSTYFR